MMAVDVTTDGPSFQAGIPRALFESHVTSAGRNNHVVTRDGKRFLLNVPAEQGMGLRSTWYRISHPAPGEALILERLPY
jgi:hypothetical protein